MRRFTATLALALSLGMGLLKAQDFTASLEPRLGWSWTGPSLLPATQVLEGGLDGTLGPAEAPTAQYRVRAKVELDPTPSPTGLSMDASLGEAWIKLFAGPFDLSFGNQVVAWSVSDAFTPSDVVNPQDLRLPVDPAKIAVPLVRLAWTGGPVSLDLVAQPFWAASATPEAAWVPANPLGLPSSVDTAPAADWDNVAFGGRLKTSLSGLDLGLSAYRGRQSILSALVDYSGLPTYSLEYARATALGADLVLAPGAGILLKTEWVYTTLRDSPILDPEPQSASLEGVCGLEYTIGSIQAIGEYVLDWAKGEAATGDTVRHCAVLILSGESGSRLSLKVAGVYDFTGGGSGMVAPKLAYTLADGMVLSLDSFFFAGADTTRYGAWKDNALGRISLKYSF